MNESREEALGSRRLLDLAGVALLIVAVWVVFAIFSSSEFYRRVVEGRGEERPYWREILQYQLTAAMTWAWFTPFVIFVAERVPLRRPHRLRNAALILAGAPFLAALRAAFGGVIHQLGTRTDVTLDFILLSVNVRIHRNIGLLLVIVGVTNLVLAQREAAARERHELALKAAVANAELRRIRATLHPRFLFSAIDSVAGEVATQPEVADRMLIQLADLLRTVLRFGESAAVSLGQELDVVDRTLDLERTRTAGAFATRVDLDEELLGARVPPLVVHGLVESAIRGGARGGRLEIRGSAERDLLRIEVVNDDAARAPDDHALDRARARLSSLFATGTAVQRRSENGRSVIELTMPLEVPPA